MHLDEIRIKKNNKKILCQNSITFPILYISSKNQLIWAGFIMVLGTPLSSLT